MPVIQTSDCVSRIHESLVLVTPQVYDCMCPWSQTIRSELEADTILRENFRNLGRKSVRMRISETMRAESSSRVGEQGAAM